MVGLNLGYDLRDDLHTYAGYLVDDPWNDTVSVDANPFVPNGARTYNQAIFSNVIFDVTKKLKLGFEVSKWDTHYLVLGPVDNIRFEFAGQYDF